MSTTASSNKETVLIALDEHSNYVFDWAIQHYLKASTTVPSQRIVLLSVIRSPVDTEYFATIGGAFAIPPVTYSIEQQEGLRQSAIARGRQLLAGYVARLEELKLGSHLDALVELGDARDGIVDVAESIGADVLILGARKMGAVKRTLLGSTSDYCIHNAQCPVIVVKEKLAVSSK